MPIEAFARLGVISGAASGPSACEASPTVLPEGARELFRAQTHRALAPVILGARWPVPRAWPGWSGGGASRTGARLPPPLPSP
ncbi:hypothetical protein [Streptomyces sp. NPDC050287]|uniref:hypothetical protein n=1 Tax=Streptomyces sp. NPDC050287 TaxID=3365608 RepID=UPI0037A146C0